MDSLFEPVAPLYDYLYRDSNRIASYSAQLFGGIMQSLEESDSLTEGNDKATKVGVPPAIHEQKKTQSNLRAQKRLKLAHDTVTSDVLSELVSTGRIAQDPLAAPHGALVLIQGTIVFIDKVISELSNNFFDSLIGGNIDASVFGMSETDSSTLHLMRNVLKSVEFPSAFVLSTHKGRFAGILKDEGMEEPIPSYYFKHGSSGLSDVHLVGIKEIPNPAVSLSGVPMLEAGQGLAQGLNEMLFPPEAIRVTPIALFRKL